jgi:molybdopterin/thiamine biosynthesis adenylyltransferase
MKPLAEARVLLVGMGGLGSPAALILAQAGVGTLGLSDRDTVDLSNLHRQLLYRDVNIGKPKTVCAAIALQESFPRLQTEQLGAISTEEAARIFSQWDVVIDGVDSVEMKFALSDAAVQSQTPLVHGGVVQQRGSVLSNARRPLLSLPL